MNHFPNNLRSQGVVPLAQNSKAPTKTLVNMSKLEFYGVQFGDEQGEAHTTTVVKMGDVWYMPANAEEWSRLMRPVAPWLGKQLQDRAVSSEAELPKQDSVDVTGG